MVGKFHVAAQVGDVGRFVDDLHAEQVTEEAQGLLKVRGAEGDCAGLGLCGPGL